MMVTHTVKLLCVLFLLSVMSRLSTSVATAHGEDRTILIEHQQLGPYQVSLVASPGIVRVGEMRFLVLIDEQRHQRALWTPTLDQQVLVSLHRLDNTDESLQIPALLIADPPVIGYEAQLTIPRAGRYQITVEMTDAQQVRRWLTTEVHVRALIIFQRLILALSILTILIAAWLVKEGVVIWFYDSLDHVRVAG